MRFTRLVSLVTATVVVSFNMNAQCRFNKMIEDDSTHVQHEEEGCLLQKRDLPDAVDYEIPEEKRHCKRLIDEEPNLDTLIFRSAVI